MGLCPQVPPNSHLLSEPPPTTPHPPQCPESMGEWTQGGGGEYVGSMTLSLWTGW